MSRLWTFFNWFFYLRFFSRGARGRVRAPGRIRIEIPRLVDVRGDIYFGPGVTIMNRSMVRFGDNVIVGPNVCFIDYNHNYRSQQFIPYSKENNVKGISIGNNVWIGYGSIILPGVSVGEGAIVAAGSVVKSNVPQCAIVAGNPAVVVSHRDESVYANLRDKPEAFYLRSLNGVA